GSARRVLRSVPTRRSSDLAGDALVRPIRALHRGAAALARGDLTHRVGGDRRGDELGDLARAFNAMASEIERWNTELARRVEEKTDRKSTRLKSSHGGNSSA